jgi:4'-phosphopantetheinyl transferase EntD
MSDSNPVRLSDGFQNLFPAGVVATEMRVPGDVALLLPEEAACLGRAVAKRRQEFAAGRQCARRALRELGVVDFPLRVGADREPLWPRGFVGSITHTAGICAAVVASRERFRGLGVDAEIVGVVGAELWPSICVAAETAWLASLPHPERAPAVTLIFAAKEAFYKAQFPLARERLHFHDIGIDVPVWSTSRGSFLVRPLRPIWVSEFVALPLRGEYGFFGEFAAAGVAIGARRLTTASSMLG